MHRGEGIARARMARRCFLFVYRRTRLRQEGKTPPGIKEIDDSPQGGKSLSEPTLKPTPKARDRYLSSSPHSQWLCFGA